MSQNDILKTRRATYLGLEEAFGTTPSGSPPNAMMRVFPIGDDLILGPLATEVLPVNDERVSRTAAIAGVLGLQSGAKLDALKTYLKAVPAAAFLGASGTVTPLTPYAVLEHALGATFAHAGSTCDTGSTTTSVAVQSGDGANFNPGTWILVENAAHEMEEAKITAITGDALTVAPALSGGPASGAIVRNLYNACPAENHANSMCVQQAFVGDAAAQWTVNGCVGDVAFDFGDFGKLATMSLSLQATSYTGPSAQGLSVAPAADEMSAPFVFKPTVYLGASIARNAPLVCDGVQWATKNDWTPVMDPNAAQAISHYVNAGGRPSMVTGMVRTRLDVSARAAFAARTPQQFVIVQKIGTGVTASFWIWEIPAAVLSGDPKIVDVRKLLGHELALEGLPDTSVTGDDDDDFVHAVGRIAFG